MMDVLFGIAIGALIAFGGVILGVWLVKQSQPFSSSAKKGEVFSITDGLDEPEFPVEEQVLKRTNEFLKSMDTK